MNWETFGSLEEAMACVRHHEEVSNNRYVIVKRRKRGKSIIHNVYSKKRATERVSETDSDRQKYNPTVQKRHKTQKHTITQRKYTEIQSAVGLDYIH